MKQLTSIEFVFDSCCKVDIPIKYFGYVNIDGIRDVTKRYALNCVATVKQASLVEFVIFKEANKDAEYTNACTVFGRFQVAHDITHIFLHYEDGSCDKIYVDFKARSKCSWQDNVYENLFVSKAGDLYLTISKDSDTAHIHEGFPYFPEEIDNLRKQIEAL